MYQTNPQMLFMIREAHLMPGPYGLVTTGFGAVEDMYTNADIGPGEELIALMYAVAGIMEPVVMHGTGDIGDNWLAVYNVQLALELA
jgi:hypothetical protein